MRDNDQYWNSHHCVSSSVDLYFERFGEIKLSYLFTATAKTFDDFAIQLQREWWRGTTVRTDNSIAGAVWTHVAVLRTF